MKTNTVTFDRRQVYRPFLERLNPAALGVLEELDLIVPSEHDPRDPDQPPIHAAFASTAELSRGVQMALVGGIGSGKSTELRLTCKVLERHKDAINILVDLAELTDLNAMNPGAILIAIGLRLYFNLTNAQKQNDLIKASYQELQVMARGKKEWVEYPGDYERDYEPDDRVLHHARGLLEPRFPAIQRKVKDVRGLVVEIAKPLLDSNRQITVLVDGLDRLIRPEQFREFAEQDLRALRDHKISVVVAAPLLLWFDETRFLQNYFDDVKHIPAAISDPEKSDFLKQILLRRGAADLMDERAISTITRFSGGVLRDLITLARTSAEAAYREDINQIFDVHVQSAVRQLGKRYCVGLGKTQMGRINRLLQNEEFSLDDPVGKELLINRQVLEHFSAGREYFVVHPALAEVLRRSA